MHGRCPCARHVCDAPGIPRWLSGLQLRGLAHLRPCCLTTGPALRDRMAEEGKGGGGEGGRPAVLEGRLGAMPRLGGGSGRDARCGTVLEGRLGAMPRRQLLPGRAGNRRAASRCGSIAAWERRSSDGLWVVHGSTTSRGYASLDVDDYGTPLVPFRHKE